jgi:cytochrome c oxidase subunit 1
MLNEPLGKVHFWLTTVLFNCVFIPQFILGMGGHMRRIYDPTAYDFLKPMQHLNVFITVSAILLLLAQIPLVVNVVLTLLAGKQAPDNPWHANTLEWATSSPPPHGNFAEQPVVYRGPYRYSSPHADGEDWLPQNRPAVAPAH